MKTKTFLISTIGAAALSAALATGASALTFGDIPGGGANTNQGVMPIYGTSSRDGFYGANLYLFGGGGTADITIDYLGAEAGFQNQFVFNGMTEFTTPGGGSVWPGVGSAVTISNVADGLLDFGFIAGDGVGTTAMNGSNPDDSGGTSSVNFFATLVTNLDGTDNDGSGTSGLAWDLWFDDGGAGNDDNHDDMAIRISISAGSINQVPVPAAGIMLLTALGGLGFARRRKQRKS